jgi:hypothetical protein
MNASKQQAMFNLIKMVNRPYSASIRARRVLTSRVKKAWRG